METTRRKWLTQAGVLFLGAGLAGLRAKASPVIEPVYFLPEPDDGPIRLSSNENPYGPSPMARAAMAESVSISNRYQWQMVRDLISAIAVKNNVANENVLIGAGSTQIIDTVIQLAALQKGNFILAEPTFNRWTSAAERCGIQKMLVQVTEDKRHDLTAMINAIKPDTRMVYICNPNNPTGTICKYDALVAFVKEATKKTLVIVDEAYLDYTNETSLSSLLTENVNLIVVKTFSKIYGLAGARIGYALAHAKTIERLGQLQSGVNVGVSAASLAGAIASLKDTDFVKESYLQNEKTRAYTIQQLERLNIPCIPSYTNFIYFSLQNYTKDFFDQLKRNNIEGTHIYEENGKWSRITVGTMQEMKRLISAIG
ncbi:MAG: aminotransferase [Flavipsychrobacter sp.]|jgi:histidinol-phosphate aminotransferase|nr:aminotransferase [Flavipsychrobacter sp.]